MSGNRARDGAGDSLRVDKWLWRARFFKSRTLANAMVAAGRLRVNRQPVAKPHHLVRPGDVLTFPQGPHIRVVEVTAIGRRRGPAAEARTLYSDLAPPLPGGGRDAALPAPARRDQGSGRPTKKQRRDTERLRG